MPSESGEWSYNVVRDLWNIWAKEKTKSKTPTLTTKLPTYTHTNSQPTCRDTFLGVPAESGLAGTGELICCSLSHRRFCGTLSRAEIDALLEERSEDRGVCPYPIPPWTFPMLVGLSQPPRLLQWSPMTHFCFSSIFQHCGTMGFFRSPNTFIHIEWNLFLGTHFKKCWSLECKKAMLWKEGRICINKREENREPKLPTDSRVL